MWNIWNSFQRLPAVAGETTTPTKRLYILECTQIYLVFIFINHLSISIQIYIYEYVIYESVNIYSVPCAAHKQLPTTTIEIPLRNRRFSSIVCTRVRVSVHVTVCISSLALHADSLFRAAYTCCRKRGQNSPALRGVQCFAICCSCLWSQPFALDCLCDAELEISLYNNTVRICSMPFSIPSGAETKCSLAVVQQSVRWFGHINSFKAGTSTNTIFTLLIRTSM